MKLLSLSAGKELKREECCKLLSTVGLAQMSTLKEKWMAHYQAVK